MGYSHGVTKSRTRLSTFIHSSFTHLFIHSFSSVLHPSLRLCSPAKDHLDDFNGSLSILVILAKHAVWLGCVYF